MASMVNAAATLSEANEGLTVDINEVLSLEEWVAYVQEESKQLLASGMTREERYRLLIEEAVGSLKEFGVRPDVADDVRNLEQQFPEKDPFEVAEVIVAQTRFIPTAEPAEVPLRERKLVKHMVAEIHALVAAA